MLRLLGCCRAKVAARFGRHKASTTPLRCTGPPASPASRSNYLRDAGFKRRHRASSAPVILTCDIGAVATTAPSITGDSYHAHIAGSSFSASRIAGRRAVHRHNSRVAQALRPDDIIYGFHIFVSAFLRLYISASTQPTGPITTGARALQARYTSHLNAKYIAIKMALKQVNAHCGHFAAYA